MSRIRSQFRDFAELEPVDFAQMHGPVPIGAPHMTEGELQTAWREERALVRGALVRWEAIRAAVPDPALGRVRADRKAVASLSDLMVLDWRTSDEKNRHELAGIISAQLERHVTLRLGFDLRTLYAVSRAGLLGSIWLRMARAVSGEGCEWCGLELESKRADARFCGSGCKLRANRAGRPSSESTPAFTSAPKTSAKKAKKKAVRIAPNRP